VDDGVEEDFESLEDEDEEDDESLELFADEPVLAVAAARLSVR
jgi:hypothetical protein